MLVTFQLILMKDKDSLNFLNFLSNKYSNIKSTIEKQVNNSTAFLDIFISVTDNPNLTLKTYHNQSRQDVS